MPSTLTPSTARRHASSETVERAARRYVELLDQNKGNPDVKPGVLAERAGAAFGVCPANVRKAAKALSLPVARLEGANGQGMPLALKEAAAMAFHLAAVIYRHKSVEECAWMVASRLGVHASHVRQWARDMGLRFRSGKRPILVGGEQ